MSPLAEAEKMMGEGGEWWEGHNGGREAAGGGRSVTEGQHWLLFLPAAASLPLSVFELTVASLWSQIRGDPLVRRLT